MNSIRIKNLRSFKDTGEIELKKINFLVGQNSSGKSTFLRFFPLIKQSILKNTKGPILWYDESLVDFGNYQVSKNRYSDDKEGISFSFDTILDFQEYHYFENNGIKKNTAVKTTLTLIEENKNTYIKTLKVFFGDQKILIDLKSDNTIEKLEINDWDFIKESENKFQMIEGDKQNFIPFLIVLQEKPLSNLIDKKIEDKIKSIINNKKVTQGATKILQNTILGSKNETLESLKNANKIRSWQEKCENWSIENKDFIELNNYFILYRLRELLFIINNNFISFFKNCDYIAPVRAKALRYYRRQDLSDINIDAYGDNLPMFLNNLPEKMKESFSSYVFDLFGFSIETESNFGHIAINVKNKNKESFNLTDLGFGYSQLLPIITKLWHSLYQNNNQFRQTEDKKTILIEQPELHLHPAMQAQLADAFVKTIEIAKKEKKELTLIIETHSPVIINRIGRRIREKTLSDKLVSVVLFELDTDLQTSKVTTTEYNEKGMIKKWPLGFFDPN